MWGFSLDERGVNEMVSFAISLGILAMFAAMYFPVGAEMFKGATGERAVDQMEYEGQNIAGSIEEVDRLARQSNSTGPIGTTVGASAEAAGLSYYVEVNYSSATNRGEIHLYTTGDDEVEYSVRVEFRSVTPVKEQTIDGGPVRVVRQQGEAAITVKEVEQ
jgi:hypothetical protein